MSYKVTLLPSQQQFEVSEGQTILEAALQCGVQMPSRCKVGVCTTCLCKKSQGDVHYQLEPMLTQKEQEQGWIFPCLAYAKSHLILILDE
ncbi:2Fe-2S iron-sulfur cluster binding domain-containing protein [Vibrio sp. S11_S32]|uniref:2Fe-2S iron-sulfur cluster-binding protein n=1 Tax=Vibrio sp. S11_S32 TaxID=2720225 RepID=UPI001680FFF9|nr:2Fe-2S iron-sulfur cluster-binding protein [Vibrio sp. S11_S32]MBD1577261.1 2Fe-2S iron-sulfur cluster binding domain-containing protein [Vibrio sp. S11_S32]